MVFQSPESMDDFLRPTVLCDYENSQIKDTAQKLTKNAASPEEAALCIFNFVRDKIIFGLDFPETKASDTLGKGFGFCVTKTNLQIALLRAVGIPGRYHQVDIRKDILKGIFPSISYYASGKTIWFHPWCECYLSGKWLACDCVMDSKLYDSIIKKNILNKKDMPTITWDGISDLKTVSSWIIRDMGVYASYDEICKKIWDELPIPVNRFMYKIAIKITNSNINRVRHN